HPRGRRALLAALALGLRPPRPAHRRRAPGCRRRSAPLARHQVVPLVWPRVVAWFAVVGEGLSRGLVAPGTSWWGLVRRQLRGGPSRRGRWPRRWPARPTPSAAVAERRNVPQQPCLRRSAGRSPTVLRRAWSAPPRPDAGVAM